MKEILIIIASISTGLIGHVQEIVKWNFSAKKMADKTYEIHLTPTVEPPWHIYSQSSPEGGVLPTTISFNKNPVVIIEGKTKEIGKIISKYEEVFDVTVKYLEGRVDFVQKVKLRRKVKTNISGKIQYMACNAEQCTPPQEVSFSVTLQ